MISNIIKFLETVNARLDRTNANLVQRIAENTRRQNQHIKNQIVLALFFLPDKVSVSQLSRQLKLHAGSLQLPLRNLEDGGMIEFHWGVSGQGKESLTLSLTQSARTGMRKLFAAESGVARQKPEIEK